MSLKTSKKGEIEVSMAQKGRSFNTPPPGGVLGFPTNPQVAALFSSIHFSVPSIHF